MNLNTDKLMLSKRYESTSSYTHQEVEIQKKTSTKMFTPF